MDSPTDSACGRGHTSGGSLGIRHSLDHSLVPPTVVITRAAWCSSGRPSAFANASLVAAPPRPDPVSLLSSSTRPQHGRVRQLGGRAGSAPRAARAAIGSNASAVDGHPSAGAHIATCAAPQADSRHGNGAGPAPLPAVAAYLKRGGGPWATASAGGLGPQGQQAKHTVSDGEGVSSTTASAAAATRAPHLSAPPGDVADTRRHGAAQRRRACADPASNEQEKSYATASRRSWQ